ncbi:thioredoxin domain-containing protein [Candidatus Daviesbacteria bacterium]|nr:thioredoxin domain-containing protein [Candidatus Daviesbacteria bacterium]
MKTETKILGAILVLTAVILFGGIFFLSKFSANSSSVEEKIVQIDYSKGQKIGSDSAKVKLVEFSDFQCPACAQAEPFVKQLKSVYPDQVQLIYRHFPLPQHPFGKQAANWAEAAGAQGKFWEMHSKLFETQAEWSNLPDNEVDEFFLGLVKQLELDENKIKQDVEGNTFKSRIDDDVAEGQRLGVDSTPTFYINGRKVILQTFNDLNTVVAEELKK